MFIVCAGAKLKEPQRTNPETQKPGNITQQTTPPPIVVNVSPPQKTIEEIEREAKEREEKSDLDRKLVKLTGDLANYTFALFAATVALVLATACLGIFGWKQSRDMKDSIAVAKDPLMRPRGRLKSLKRLLRCCGSISRKQVAS